MARKLLVIGSRGLLGSVCVARVRERGWDAVGADVGEIDITEAASVEGVFGREQPNAVVNCAAYTDVEGAETSEGRVATDRINGLGVGILAEACFRHHADFVHLSTDYVFNGTSSEGAAEADIPGEAMNAYGETKRAGELRVIEAAGGLDGSNFCRQDPRFYLVRTSWLFGASARNFVAKVAERARAAGEVSVVTDEVGSPTYVNDLAERLMNLLEGNAVPGIYHATGEGSCSRFEFAKTVIEGLGIPATVKPTELSAFPRKAHIASVSVLKNTKLPPMRSWREMVKAYCEEAV